MIHDEKKRDSAAATVPQKHFPCPVEVITAKKERKVKMRPENDNSREAVIPSAKI